MCAAHASRCVKEVVQLVTLLRWHNETRGGREAGRATSTCAHVFHVEQEALVAASRRSILHGTLGGRCRSADGTVEQHGWLSALLG